MIITETISINGKEFTKTYSDEGFYIQKVGTEEVYSEAVDPIDSGRTYTETDVPIVEYYTDETEAKARAYEILMGERE